MNRLLTLPKFSALTEVSHDSALRRFWLIISLFFAALYSCLGLLQAFRGEYIVQDDVRQHVFWMWRFVDPDLLVNDLITDYFESVAPAGYHALNRVMAALGIHPLLFCKILPPILGFILTIYGFLLCLEIMPIPAIAFVSTVIFNQSLWMEGDLGSGTPRAFIFPLLLPFLYYLLCWNEKHWKRTAIACSGIIILEGLFYQPMVLISLAILGWRLLQWDKFAIRFSNQKAV